MRSSICAKAWQQIKAGYAAGTGLREIARKMNIPEGTVLAPAKREEWTQQIGAAKRRLLCRNQMQSAHCNQSQQ